MSRNCPVCDFTEKTELMELCNNMKIMGPQFPETSSSYVQCKKCGCVYVEADFTQKDWDNYYASGFSKRLRYSEVFGKELANKYYEDMYSIVFPYINEDSFILDFGAAGRGEFARFLMNKGHKNVFACDIAQYVVDDAKKLGVNAFTSKFVNDNQDLKGEFDLIIPLHSFALEHIFDFRKALLELKTMLKPDGYLLLDIPDSTKYSDIDISPFFFFTYEHQMHLTDKTLQNIGKAYGLKLLSCDIYLKVNEMYDFYSLYKNGDKIEALEYEDKTADAVLKYNKLCRTRLKMDVEQFEKSQELLTLWGIGASSAILLNKTFDKCNVAKLVDSNPSRQGIEFEIAGKKLKVKSAETIGKDDTILVLPALHKEPILRQIRDMGIANKVVTLSK